MTDWVKIYLENGYEGFAYEVFDEDIATALVLDPSVNGSVVTFYALLYMDVSFSTHDTITVKLQIESVM